MGTLSVAELRPRAERVLNPKRDRRVQDLSQLGVERIRARLQRTRARNRKTSLPVPTMEASDGSPTIGRITGDLALVARDLRALRVREPASDGGVRLQRALDLVDAALASLNEERVSSAAGADLSGSARSVPVQDLLAFLATARKTGIVRVETPAERFLVQLDEGAVVYAYGDRPPEGDGPADALVERGWISRESSQALPGAAAQSAWLDPRLLESAHLPRAALHAALAHQTRCAFYRLCAAEEGRYGFFDGARVQNVVRVHHSAVELLLEYHRARDEALRPREAPPPAPEELEPPPVDGAPAADEPGRAVDELEPVASPAVLAQPS
jgi:hypothetical protein